MELLVLRKNDYPRAAWKNGLGTTAQIAIEPPQADLRRGDFLFRLSSARIERNSPFSPFPEHDRTLVLLEGQGLRLIHSLDGEEDEQRLGLFEPVEFPGDLPTNCELLGGPVTDLGLISRQGAVTSEVAVVDVPPTPGFEWQPHGRWNFLYCASGVLIIHPREGATSEGSLRLEAGDTLFLRVNEPLLEDETVRIESERADARVVSIAIEEA